MMTAADLASIRDFIKEWSAVAVALVALFAIVGGKRPMGAVERWRDGVLKALLYPFMGEERARTRMEKFEKALGDILVELKTNGGTSLKDAVNRIEESQVRFSGRFDLLLAMDDADAMFEADREGLCIWVSPAHQRLTGRAADEVLGWGWIAAVHEGDVEHVRHAWKSAVEERRAFSASFRIVRPGGTVVAVRSVAKPMTAGLTLIGWAGVVTVDDAPG